MVAGRRENSLRDVLARSCVTRADSTERAQGTGPGHRQVLRLLPDVDADAEDDHRGLVAVGGNRVGCESPGGLRYDELTEDAGDLARVVPAGHRGHGCRVIGQGDDVVGPLGPHPPGQVLDERSHSVADGQAAQQRQPAQALNGDQGPQDHGDQEGAAVVGGDPGAPGPPSAGGLPQSPERRQVRPGPALRPQEGRAQVVLSGSGDGNGIETREGGAT